MRTNYSIPAVLATIVIGMMPAFAAAETLVIQTWSGVWETGDRKSTRLNSSH